MLIQTQILGMLLEKIFILETLLEVKCENLEEILV